MNLKAIIMNKQIMLAVGMILFVGAVVTYGTGAFFSDTANATGNVFSSGTLHLKLTNIQGGSNPEDTKDAVWNFSNMAPGGTYATSSVWLRNTGSLSGESLAIGITSWANNPSNIAKQMRIAEMTLDGNNLLKGGAGATIPEYEAPTNCTVTLSGSDRLTDAISSASDGDVICATGSNYSSTWEYGASKITVNVPNVTIASVNGPDNTKSIGFDVTADGVTITGFSIDTNEVVGIQVTDADGVTVEHNVFKDFGSAAGTVNTHAVYLVNGSSDALVQYNVFDGVRADTKSAKAIYVGHTAGTPGASNIEISNNIIKNVESNKGAYGILVNAAGSTSGLSIHNNTIDGLSGGWTHAIGLEGATPNAVVALNTFADLSASGADNTAVFFENNPSASSVMINQNNFEKNVLAIALHPVNQVGTYSIDATDNWWGDFDPSDQIFEVNSTIDTSNFAGGPFAGLVNGADTNGNGFADLQDLKNSHITDITPGLDPYDGSNDKEFYLAVQLDGPSTTNSFQGLTLDGVNIEFTLNQL